MYVQVMHPSQFRRVRGAERRRSSSGRATRANPCQLGWHSPCVTTATATLSHECTAQKQSTRAAPQRPRSRAAHTVPDTAEAVDPAESCDDVAGGCQAPWDDSEVRLSNPTPVRAQLLESDPGLNQNLISSQTTVAQIFNQDMWEKHRRPDRYILYLMGMGQSTVLRRIFRPCMAFSAIAFTVSAINSLLPSHWPQVSLSLVPHTLLGAALSLLLVFRTNSSYARFVEGRMLWGTLVRCARNWIRLAATYMRGDIACRAARYIQVLAFVLKSHLRAGRTRSNASDPTAYRDDPSTVVRELLPPDEAEAVLAQKNKPFFVICRMTALAREAQGSQRVPSHVLLSLDQSLCDMLQVVGGCDRILGTPIPLSYTRHTSRSLVMWLASLPLALWPSAGWWSVPAMFFISFIFLGIDEIGVEIEEPFCVLPLLPMCRTIVNDVKLAFAAQT